MTLGDIKCQNQNIFLVIETTCPLPRVAPPPAPRDDTVVLDMKDFPLEDEDGEGEEEDDDERSEAGMDADKSVVPEWLKAELQDAKSDERRGRRGKKKRKAHERRVKRGAGQEQVSNISPRMMVI